MRCQLVSMDGVVLGELMIAQGLTLSDVGREMVRGRSFVVLPVEPEPQPDSQPETRRKAKTT